MTSTHGARTFAVTLGLMAWGAMALAACNKKQSESAEGGANPTSTPSPSATSADPVQTLLAGYVSVPACLDRLPFILNPVANREALVDHYRSVAKCGGKWDSIDTTSCKTLDNGYCYPVVGYRGGKNAFGVDVTDSDSFCVVQTPQGPKIDWRCSVGYNPVTVPAFKAQHTTKQPSIFRFEAKLDDYYNYEFADAKDTHYSIGLQDGANNQIYAYVPKKSPDGQKLFDGLKDGKEHPVLIEIAYPANSGSSSVAAVTRLLGFGWREQAGEFPSKVPAASSK